MKTFTVKDFIEYNAPCFSCGSAINFQVLNNPNDGAGTTGPTTNLRPEMRADHFAIYLSITYKRIVQLNIYFKSNKIETSHSEEVAHYLSNNHLVFKSHCQRCYSTIESDTVEFNLQKGFLKPIKISTERLKVADDKKMYDIHTYYHGSPDPSTVVYITSLDKKATTPPGKFNLPHFPLWKFKTKKRLLNKMKTYLVFS